MVENKVYICYLRNDPGKEVLNKINAASYDDALLYFAGRKQIDTHTFLRLFEIKLYENKPK